MNDPRRLKAACACVAVVLIGLVLFGLSQPSGVARSNDPTATANGSALQVGRINANPASPDEQPVSDVPQAPRRITTLRVGRIGATPGRNEIATIAALPVLDSEINRLYIKANQSPCQMLPPGTAVLAPLTTPTPGQATTIGRVPAITIGLQLAEKGRSKLPAVTRGQVDQYFAEHRLSIQPIVYCDEAGSLYFGTDCQAAFFELDRPGSTVRPEPLIEAAISKFRPLGIVEVSLGGDAGVGASLAGVISTDTGRTLAMAFSFEIGDGLVSSIDSPSRMTTELLLFHLPPTQPVSTAKDRQRSGGDAIAMDVFVTTDQRKNLHRLDLIGSEIDSPIPTINAEVRFDKMILMGLYPAVPIVTDFRFRSSGIIAMESIQRLMAGVDDRTLISLTEILDRYGSLVGSPSMVGPSPVGDVPLKDSPLSQSPTLRRFGNGQGGALDPIDEQSLRETARRKYQRLEQSLRPAEPTNDPLAMPKVRRMTGVGK